MTEWLFRMLAAALVAAFPAASAAQQRVDRPGTVAHGAADTGFPERIGEFERTNVQQYDAQGLDMSAGYSLLRPEGRVELTVYIYPSAMVAAALGRRRANAAAWRKLCEQEFEGVEQIILARFAGAERIAQGGAPAVEGVEAALARRSLFGFEAEWDGARQPLRSEADLYCFVDRRWQVKYRVTGPAGAETDGAVERFIRTGPWPGRQPAPTPAPEEVVARPESRAIAATGVL